MEAKMNRNVTNEKENKLRWTIRNRIERKSVKQVYKNIINIRKQLTCFKGKDV